MITLSAETVRDLQGMLAEGIDAHLERAVSTLREKNPLIYNMWCEAYLKKAARPYGAPPPNGRTQAKEIFENPSDIMEYPALLHLAYAIECERRGRQMPQVSNSIIGAVSGSIKSVDDVLVAVQPILTSDPMLSDFIIRMQSSRIIPEAVTASCMTLILLANAFQETQIKN